MATPIHTHDCDGCTFTGTIHGIDHYFCEQPDREIELLARRSSQEDDYTAMPLSWVVRMYHYPLPGRDPVLGDSLRLWREFSR
jgi:hypothetical protein